MSFEMSVSPPTAAATSTLSPTLKTRPWDWTPTLRRRWSTETAKAFNELLPIIPLWERYGNNPAMDGLHTCGWLPDDNHIYANSPYADSFTVMMIMDGTLYPCNQ